LDDTPVEVDKVSRTGSIVKSSLPPAKSVHHSPQGRFKHRRWAEIDDRLGMDLNFQELPAYPWTRTLVVLVIMKVTRNDPTPNPDAIKFVLDGQIVSAGSRSFRDRTLCEDPIAKRLFEIEEVVSVFFVSSVVTVTKDPFGDWSILIPRINQVLEEATDGFEPANPPRVVPASPVAPDGESHVDEKFFDRPYQEKITVINALFDEAVRPGLASDGGGLLVVEVVEKVVRIQYQGACGSCPSSTAGTLSFIENVLRSKLHPTLEVELA